MSLRRGWPPKGHLTGADKTLRGDPVGHWEGDILGVETRIFHPKMSHSRLISTNQLQLTECIYEYSCHEGNYGLEGALTGVHRGAWDGKKSFY